VFVKFRRSTFDYHIRYPLKLRMIPSLGLYLLIIRLIKYITFLLEEGNPFSLNDLTIDFITIANIDRVR
jgi:hypothetical protein